MLPLVVAGPGLSAWSVAMLFALSALLLADISRTPRARGMSGLLVGMAFLCRLDLGAYALIAALAACRDWRLAASFLTLVVPVGLILVFAVPPMDLVSQLIWYPLIGTRQYRSLPLPIPWDAASIGGMYQALAFHYLPIAAVVTSGAWLVRHRMSVVFSLVVFASLCQLQALGRADDFHAAQAFTPAFLLVALWLPSTWPPPPRRLVLLVMLLPATLMPLIAGAADLRSGRARFDEELDRAVAYVRASTSESEPLFVGLTSNRYTFSNPMLAYFLAERRPGVRNVMYAPGITNSDAAQAAMTHELDTTGTNYAILSITMSDTFEAFNDSRIPGSTILDEYLAQKFEAVYSGTEVVVLRRISAGPSN